MNIAAATAASQKQLGAGEERLHRHKARSRAPRRAEV